MKELLKAAAALVFLYVATNYAVSKVVGKALTLAEVSTDGFDLDSQPVQIPEFDLNTDWAARQNGLQLHSDHSPSVRGQIPSHPSSGLNSSHSSASRLREQQNLARDFQKMLRNSPNSRVDIKRER